MKEVFMRLFGDNFVYRFLDLKIELIPSKTQKRRIEQEKEDTIKRKAFYSNFAKSGDLCFDVGANIGNRITPLLELGAKVVAVEPQESCYRFLKYKFGDRIELVTKGLDEKESVKDFHISNATTISTFSTEWIDSVKNGRFKQHNWNKVVQVEMTTLDNLIAKYGTPKFMKVDVEGYELNVLKGLTSRIPLISFEYALPELLNNANGCIKQLEKINPEIECNYSIGESMKLELKEWISAKEMLELINSEAFIATSFGDVYIRQQEA